MPKLPGKSLSYVKDLKNRATVAGKRMLDNRAQYAEVGKNASRSVAKKATTGISSGARAMAKHPYRSGAAGVAGLGAASYMTGGSRRGRGVDKMRSGRPTGMYKY